MDDKIVRKQTKNDRITGKHLLRFKIKNAISDFTLSTLFGLSPGKVKALLSSADPIKDPVVCYLYHQYTENASLMEPGVNLAEFYRLIGGKDAISGSDFSLILGRELSAYIRYFDGGSGTRSMEIMIQNAMKLAEKNPQEAFNMIRELCHREGVSRGFDPLETRKWGIGKPLK